MNSLVLYLEKYTYLFTCRELNETIDATHAYKLDYIWRDLVENI